MMQPWLAPTFIVTHTDNYKPHNGRVLVTEQIYCLLQNVLCCVEQ